MKKLLVAALAMTLSVAAFAKDKAAAKSSDGKLATVSGIVTDEACAKDSAKAANPDCVKKCVDGGKALVLVNDKDQSVWTVKNPEALKGHEGHHVKVKAHVYDDKSVHIESVSMIKEKASKGDKKAEPSEHKS
jgi:hypothetical protein